MLQPVSHSISTPSAPAIFPFTSFVICKLMVTCENDAKGPPHQWWREKDYYNAYHVIKTMFCWSSKIFSSELSGTFLVPLISRGGPLKEVSHPDMGDEPQRTGDNGQPCHRFKIQHLISNSNAKITSEVWPTMPKSILLYFPTKSLLPS